MVEQIFVSTLLTMRVSNRRWPLPRLDTRMPSGASSRTGETTSVGSSSTPLRRSEEHTSELQSRENLVCRLLLEKKKKTHINSSHVKTSYEFFCMIIRAVHSYN